MNVIRDEQILASRVRGGERWQSINDEDAQRHGDCPQSLLVLCVRVFTGHLKPVGQDDDPNPAAESARAFRFVRLSVTRLHDSSSSDEERPSSKSRSIAYCFVLHSPAPIILVATRPTR